MEIHVKKKFRPLAIVEFATVLFMTAIFFAVVVQVLSRFFLNSIPSWTGEEAVTFLMIWMIMMGSATAMGYKSHIVVDVLVNLAPPRIRLFMNRLTYIILTLFLGYFTIVGAIYVWGNRRMFTPRLRIPTLLQQGCIPLGCGIMFLFVVYYLIQSFRSPAPTTEDKPC